MRSMYGWSRRGNSVFAAGCMAWRLWFQFVVGDSHSFANLRHDVPCYLFWVSSRWSCDCVFASSHRCTSLLCIRRVMSWDQQCRHRSRLLTVSFTKKEDTGASLVILTKRIPIRSNMCLECKTSRQGSTIGDILLVVLEAVALTTNIWIGNWFAH